MVGRISYCTARLYCCSMGNLEKVRSAPLNEPLSELRGRVALKAVNWGSISRLTLTGEVKVKSGETVVWGTAMGISMLRKFNRDSAMSVVWSFCSRLL